MKLTHLYFRERVAQAIRLSVGVSFVYCVCVGALLAGGGPNSLNREPPQTFITDITNTPYQVSFLGGEIDPSGNPLWGNNLMKFVPFHGRLYASTAVECDVNLNPNTSKNSARMISIPEPQIMVLDHSQGRWRLEKNFGRNHDGTPLFKRVANVMVAKFAADYSGNRIERPVEMLIATLATFTSKEKCAIYTGIDKGGVLEWARTNMDQCIGESGRALIQYRDPVTHADRIFIGTQSNHLPSGQIQSGAYDPNAPGLVRWDSPEESGHPHRVMSFATMDNRLFATLDTQVIERFSRMTAFGPEVTWRPVWKYSGSTPLPLAKGNSGIRGLTPLLNSSGKPNSMLAVLEGPHGDILNFELTSRGISVQHETPVDQILERLPFGGNEAGGRRRVPYIIAAFNDIPTIEYPETGQVVSLIGIEKYNKIPGHLRSSWFVARDQEAHYSLHEVKQLPLRKGIDQPLDPDLGLRAVRTIVVSPFPEDHGRVLFIGGFDPLFECGIDPRGDNQYNLHGNAWGYRVGINTALAPYTE